MAKKTTPKKPAAKKKAAAPVQKYRSIFLRLDARESEIIEKIVSRVRNKTASGAILNVCSDYIRSQEEIKDLRERIRQNEQKMSFIKSALWEQHKAKQKIEQFLSGQDTNTDDDDQDEDENYDEDEDDQDDDQY